MQTLFKKGTASLKALVILVIAALAVGVCLVWQSVAYAGDTPALTIYIQEGESGTPSNA